MKYHVLNINPCYMVGVNNIIMVLNFPFNQFLINNIWIWRNILNLLRFINQTDMSVIEAEIDLVKMELKQFINIMLWFSLFGICAIYSIYSKTSLKLGALDIPFFQIFDVFIIVFSFGILYLCYLIWLIAFRRASIVRKKNNLSSKDDIEQINSFIFYIENYNYILNPYAKLSVISIIGKLILYLVPGSFALSFVVLFDKFDGLNMFWLIYFVILFCYCLSFTICVFLNKRYFKVS